MLEPIEETQTNPEPRPDPTVRCRFCGHGLTARSKAIAVNGAHEHTFRNPAGYSFHVVCYADAPGCLLVGPATPEASWFPGFDWSFALCGKCREHMGWWYVGRTAELASFAGLIATRLAGR